MTKPETNANVFEDKAQSTYERLDTTRKDDERLEGDFVSETQEMATEQGHSHVSKLWYDRTISFEQALNILHDERRQRHDIVIPAKQFRVTSQGREIVVCLDDGREFRPTMHALFQMANWCDKVSHSTIKRLTTNPTNNRDDELFQRDEKDYETLALVYQNGHRRIDPDKEFRFRTYDDGTLRAMVTTKYAVVDNVWLMERLQQLLGDSSRVSHWEGLDPDTIFANLLMCDSIRQEQDSEYGGMVSLGNCEIGKRRCSAVPSIFRAICMNGCIWDQKEGKGISRVHRGDIDLEALANDIMESVNQQIPLIDERIDAFLATRELGLPMQEIVSVFLQIAKDHRIDTGSQSCQIVKVMDQFNKYERDNCNVFGIVNAITRAGQKDGFTPEDWVRFDEIGGQLCQLDENSWEKLKAKARMITPDERDKMLGLHVK
jgi:hypothetical protein